MIDPVSLGAHRDVRRLSPAGKRVYRTLLLRAGHQVPAKSELRQLPDLERGLEELLRVGLVVAWADGSFEAIGPDERDDASLFALSADEVARRDRRSKGWLVGQVREIDREIAARKAGAAA
jgi:hypothetical protein